MKREEILDEAKRLVCGDREETHGSPAENFARIAKLWSAYKGVEFTPEDVAAMSILTKVSRLASNPRHLDSWVDVAGYSANGGEVASVPVEAPRPAITLPRTLREAIERYDPLRHA